MPIKQAVRCALWRLLIQVSRLSAVVGDFRMMPVAKLFQAARGFRVADETYVCLCLNTNDAKSGLPQGLLDAFSLEVGEIEPGCASRIHVHVVFTEVTVVLDGRREVRLRDETAPDPYETQLAQHQAALVRPGAFLQLINGSRFTCRTLYIVGPSYVFDMDHEGRVPYEDAIVMDEYWDEFKALDCDPPRQRDAQVTIRARSAALGRVEHGHLFDKSLSDRFGNRTPTYCPNRSGPMERNRHSSRPLPHRCPLFFFRLAGSVHGKNDSPRHH